MKISTKGRYALRVMTELAKADPQQLVSIKSIARSQNISEKYLEQIIAALNKAKLVKSTRGAQGGYKLAKAPKDYTVGMIIRTIEGSLAPISCLEDEVNECPRARECSTLFVWQRVYEAINTVLDSITLQDILEHTADISDDFASGI